LPIRSGTGRLPRRGRPSTARCSLSRRRGS
jgi:hypothetical protein